MMQQPLLTLDETIDNPFMFDYQLLNYIMGQLD